jgi:hypothetical protein
MRASGIDPPIRGGGGLRRRQREDAERQGRAQDSSERESRIARRHDSSTSVDRTERATRQNYSIAAFKGP